MLLEEKIIYSNCFNEAELLRCFSKNGNNTFGVRVLSDSEICSYILMKNGINMEGTYISEKEQDFIYYKYLGNIFSDSKNIRGAINSFRDCIIGDALSEMESILLDEFPLKKETIINAYKYYIDYKKENNCYDKHDMMNFIISNKLTVSDISIEYFREMNITKLFLGVLNNSFKEVVPVSIKKYFKVEKNTKGVIKAYGKKNEIDYVFDLINRSHLKLDECQIVLINKEDMIETLVYLKKYNIPYTSAIGIPFIQTKVGMLLKTLIDLKSMNYGVDGYKLLFECEAFDASSFKEMLIDSRKYNDFIKYAGWLRLRFNEDLEEPIDINKDLYNEDVYDALITLNDDLNKGIIHFINKYIVKDEDNIAEISRIEYLLEAKEKYGIEISDFDLLSQLLSSYIKGSTSDSGCIHISGLDKAFSSIRKYNFIVGLDSDFPGNPTENYLIYDEEYRKTDSLIYISTNIIESKINKAKTFISLCEFAYLIYSFYDLLELKEKNPSSVVYDELNNKTKNKTFDFKDSSLNRNQKIILEATNNTLPIVKGLDLSDIEYDSSYLANKTYNPSAFQSFFDNKAKFLLENVFDVSIDDSDDVYSIISNKDKGTIIHKIMEGFEKTKVTKEEFIKKAEDKFEEYLKMRPAVIKEAISREKTNFLDLVNGLYDYDPNNKCVLYEETISDVAINGIKFKGKFDRLEVTKDNKYILVDYKTGRKLEHLKDDPESCIQGLLYAYMIENSKDKKYEGIKIDRIEFRYPYLNVTIPCAYNNKNRDALISKVNEFIKAIENPLEGFKITDKDSIKYIDKYNVLLSLFKEVQN